MRAAQTRSPETTATPNSRAGLSIGALNCTLARNVPQCAREVPLRRTFRAEREYKRRTSAARHKNPAIATPPNLAVERFQGSGWISPLLFSRCSFAPSATRGDSHLTHLLTMRYGRFSGLSVQLRRIVVTHGIFVRRALRAMRIEPIRMSPRQTSAHRLENFLRKQFSWILRIDLRPARLTDGENCGQSKSKKSTKKNDRQPWGKRLLLGYTRFIEDFDAGRFFGFLNLSQFILLRERFEDSFLYFG